MGYLDRFSLIGMGFKRVGNNVKVSDKASIYNPEEISIGENSRIDDFCVLSGKIDIGKNVHIAPLCLVAGGRFGIVFEDFSAIAYGSYVFTQNDDYEGIALHNPTVPVEFRHEYCAPVRIGRFSLIGTNCVITPGVNIAENCSIGAKSLVMASTQSNGIYYGIPAKRVRKRQIGIYDKWKDYERSKI